MNRWLRLSPSPESTIAGCEAPYNPALGTRHRGWEEKHKQVPLTFRWLPPRFLGWISFLRLSICLMSLDMIFSVLHSSLAQKSCSLFFFFFLL